MRLGNLKMAATNTGRIHINHHTTKRKTADSMDCNSYGNKWMESVMISSTFFDVDVENEQRMANEGHGTDRDATHPISE